MRLAQVEDAQGQLNHATWRGSDGSITSPHSFRELRPVRTKLHTDDTPFAGHSGSHASQAGGEPEKDDRIVVPTVVTRAGQRRS